MTFKVGDTVSCTKGEFLGKEGIVTSVSSITPTYLVDIPDFIDTTFLEEELELIAPFLPTIKDSGDRTKYPSGAVRDKRTGKGKYSLIPVNALERIAKHYEAGRIKYSDNDKNQIGLENWRKGMFTADFYDSATRHLESWRKGDYSEDHLAAACWNILCLMETERRIQKGILPEELDNRDINEFDNPRDLYNQVLSTKHSS